MSKIYHAVTRSIAEYRVFNTQEDFLRMKEVLRYYQVAKQPVSFSCLNKVSLARAEIMKNKANDTLHEKVVEIIAYCLMPTHIHLLVRDLKEGGISRFMNKVLNSYSRYFNLKHKRKGPLWQGRFKKIEVENDEQLLHVTRYIHLNPVTAYLVESPQDWIYSSYPEYIEAGGMKTALCHYKDLLDISPELYRKFVEERISEQRELAIIKSMFLE